jgi:hypothetical protein
VPNVDYRETQVLEQEQDQEINLGKNVTTTNDKLQVIWQQFEKSLPSNVSSCCNVDKSYI